MMAGKSIPAGVAPDDGRAAGVSIRGFADVSQACNRYFQAKGLDRGFGGINDEGRNLARREQRREEAKKRAAEMAREERISRRKGGQ